MRYVLLSLVVVCGMIIQSFAYTDASATITIDMEDAQNIYGNNTTLSGELNESVRTVTYKISLNRTFNYAEYIKIEVNQTPKPGSGGTWLAAFIYDSEKYRVAFGLKKDESTMKLSGICTESGYYYIQVSFWKGRKGLTYNLHVEKNKTFDIALMDKNNSPNDGEYIISDDVRESYIHEFYDVADFYILNLSANKTSADICTVMMEVPETGDFIIEIYPYGNSTYVGIAETGNMTFADYGVNEILYFVPEESGKYSLRIFAEHGYGNYTIKIKITKAHKDKNNDFENATTLLKHTLSDDVSANYDSQDIYKIYLRYDTTMNITLKIVDYDDYWGIPDINLWILDTNKKLINRTYKNESSKSAEATAKKTGYYYIMIGTGKNSCGHYSIYVNLTEPPEVLIPIINITMPEDSTYKINLTEVFREEKNPPIDYEVPHLQYINLNISQDEVIISPIKNWYGNINFTITAVNSVGKKAFSEVKLIVMPVNDGPVAYYSNFSFITWEDRDFILTMPIYTLFEDPDNDELEYYSVNNTHISVIIDENGTVIFHPEENWSGAEKFKMVSEDPYNETAEINVKLLVKEVNDAPVPLKNYLNVTVKEDEYITINLTDYFYDSDDEILNYTSERNYMTLFKVLENNTAKIGPMFENWYGEETFFIIASDKNNETAKIEVNITVLPVNDAPFVIRFVRNITLSEDDMKSLNLSTIFDDADGDELNYTFSGNKMIEVNISGDIITLRGQKNWYGRETIIITASDPYGASTSTQINITVMSVNDAPEIISVDYSPKKGKGKTEVIITVKCRDIDSETVIVRLIIGENTYDMKWISGNTSEESIYQYKIKLDEGKYIFYVSVDDGDKIVHSKKYDIRIEEAERSPVMVYISIAIIIILIILIGLLLSPTKKLPPWEEE